MSHCFSNEVQDNFEKPTAELLAGLGAGCFVQIQRNTQHNIETGWVEITRTEGDELIGILHPELSSASVTSSTSTEEQTQTTKNEIRLRREEITALGCDRYCFC